MNMNTLLRVASVVKETGLSRPTVYVYAASGLLTKPIKLGARASAWPADEIAAINKARIAGKSGDEIRALVAELHAKRTAT